MKANELRVGNWCMQLQTDKAYKYFNKTVITPKDIAICQAFPGYVYHEPIELTESWLIGFGFKGMYGDMHLPIDNFKLCHYVNKNRDTYLFLNKGEEELDLTDRCQYVHQLQNIYFALTGKELELT